MKAGELRDRVTIQKKTEANNSQGQPVVSWIAIYDNVPCKVEADGQATISRQFAQQLQGTVTLKISMRWIKGITNGMRMIWHDDDIDRTLSIVGHPINPDGRKREMVLLCTDPL